MGGGKSSVVVLDELSPTLTTTHYGAPAVVYALDLQGGKGTANHMKNICPTLLSDSHGTPHAIVYDRDACVGGRRCLC